jgi:uncharacterized protein (DUF58 family)
MNLIKLTAISASALFLFTVAILLRATELYLMSAAIASLPVLSAVIVLIAKRGIKCAQTMPASTHEGTAFSIDTTITGAKRALGPVWADVTLPKWLEPCCNTRSIRWSGASAIQSIKVIPKKRGLYKIGSTVLHLSDPLGLFLFSRKHTIESRLVVLPRAVRIPGLQATLPAGGGWDYDMDGASVYGGGTEFHGVREYQHGDDLKRIHWRSAAHYGKLNVIEYEQAGRGHLVIAIERKRGTEAGKGPWSTLECSIKIAAAIAKDSLKAGASVRLSGLPDGSAASLYGSGPDHLGQILYSLASLEADAEESIGPTLLRELGGMSKEAAVICLVPELTDDLAGHLAILAERGVRSHVVLLLSERGTALPSSITDRITSAGALFTPVECSRVKELAHAT